MIRNASIAAIATAACAGLTALAGCELTTIYIETGGAPGTTSTSSSVSGTGGTGGALLCIPGAMQPCYDGPAGTEGQGICRAGAQTCAADGMDWGACIGAVLPQPENCATPEDEDCDGKAPPCKGALLWAKRFGDSLDQAARGVAVDAVGNVLLTGYIDGAIDFGGGALASAGGGDIVLAKLDSDGAHLWSKRFGDAGSQAGQSVACDGAGNVLVTGYLNGVADFGGGGLTSAGGSDVFIAKFDAGGAHSWSKLFGGVLDQAGQGITVDGQGNVIVTGFVNGSIDFGGGMLMSAGGQDIFVAKFDSAGTHLWSKRFGDGSNQAGQSVAVDTAGNVFVTGYLNGSADFGGGPIVSAGAKDVFVAKLDPAGAHIWSKRFGDSGTQIGQSLALDAAGNVVLTGTFSGAIDFGGGPLASMGAGDVFVAKLDPSGGHVWSQRFGDAAAQTAESIAVDGLGNVLLTGTFNGSIDFGGGPFVSGGVGDAFIAKLDANGGHLWSKRFGDAQDQAGQGIAVDSMGNVVVTGQFNGVVDFGAGPLMSAGGSDVFVAKFSP